MTEKTRGTNITELLGELDAGVFTEILSHVVSEMALSVVEHDRPGKLSIVLDMKKLGNGQQLSVGHKIVATRPTLRGKSTEEDASDSVMYVGRGGKLTLLPENQMDWLERQEQQDQPTE